MNIEDFTPLDEAKAQYQAALARLMERGDDADAAAECERWDRVLLAHPEYRAEREQAERAWEESQAAANADALRATRGFVPADIEARSAEALVAAGFSRALANRIRQKRVLWLARMHADDIAQLHSADLKNTFVAHGLDLTEMRAVFAAVPAEFSNDPTGEKNAWRTDLRTKLRTMTARELRPNEMRNPAYHGAKPLFNPDLALSRRASVKSTAFDPVAKPDAALLGSGVQERTTALAEAKEASARAATKDEEDGAVVLPPGGTGAVKELATGLAAQLHAAQAKRKN